jgi:hypothetical protein
MQMRMCFKQELSQKQVMEQRQEAQLNLRIELLEAVSENKGLNFRPLAECPKCFLKLTAWEVLKGFNRDPYDLQTTCPRCKTRFVTELEANMTGGGYIRFPFLCPDQTLQKLTDLKAETISPAKLKKDELPIYTATIFHFGNLKEAFKKINIRYPFQENPEPAWRKQAGYFLGKLPDAEIARCFGLHPSTVSKERRAQRIPKYRSEYS